MPLVLVEGPDEAFAAAIDELRSAGWTIGGSFGQRVGWASTVAAGPVRGADDAAAALLAVLDGKGVVIHGQASRDVLDRLLGDLRHVGPVEHRRGAVSRPPMPSDDALEILRILADGRTLGDAARTIGLSRRTADRRLADVRRLLGVERTAEALARARRLGWLA